MNALKRLFLMAMFAIVTAISSTSATAAVPVVALNEQFNDVNNLSGWTFLNNSKPAGANWFQGNANVFPAYTGAPDAYIAANFNSAAGGIGSIDNWLITPQLSLLGPTTLSFFTQGAQAPGFNDTLEVRFSSGGEFSTLLTTIGGSADYPNSWEEFTASLDYTGTGRFAFRYVGDAAASNYIGIDSVLVTTVPEPSAWLMFMAGVLALAALRRNNHA